MSNFTTSAAPSESNETFNMTRFIVLESSVAAFTLIVGYLTVVFIVFECQHGECRKRGVALSTNGIKGVKFGTAMRILSIIATLFLLGRYICEHYELAAQYTGAYTYDYCNVVVKMKVTLSAISVTAIYTFLWTRQRFCYTNPAMRHLTSRITSAFSWLSLAMLFAAQIVGTILFTSTRFYKMTCDGCYNVSTTIPDFIPWIWLLGAAVCCQLLLLGLFLYPLVRHKTMMETNLGEGAEKFLPLIKRATITAVVCILSDITSSLLILVVTDDNDIIPTLAYDLSILINVVCVLLSYHDWRRILVCSCSKRKLKRSIDVAINEFHSKNITSHRQTNPNTYRSANSNENRNNHRPARVKSGNGESTESNDSPGLHKIPTSSMSYHNPIAVQDEQM